MTKTYTIDASTKSLGRIASQAAVLLMGKNKANFERYRREPVRVNIFNADRIVLTGRKWSEKKYYRHSGYLGKLKTASAERMRDLNSCRMVELAVKGMLPKNKLSKLALKSLRIYKGSIDAAAAIAAAKKR